MTFQVADTGPAVSVVIAAKTGSRSIRPCLQSICLQAEAMEAEIIVVDASRERATAEVTEDFAEVVHIQVAANSLVPAMWKIGLESARAPIVAFTIAECVPDAGWLSQVESSFQDEVVAVAGPLTASLTLRADDWALYFSRYSAWMPTKELSHCDLVDLPGDNCAYRRSALELCREQMTDGLWETFVNAHLVRLGLQLCWLPDMQVEFMGGDSVVATMQQRFRHGRHYGSNRSFGSGRERLLRFLTSPLILPLLLLRIYTRVSKRGRPWTGRLWRAMPALCLIMAAWTLGEASGYLRPLRA